MSKDLEVEGLEQEQAVVETVDSAKEEKRLEKDASVKAGVEALKEVGVSENLAKVLDAASSWYAEKEEKDEAKATLIEAFGGTDALKDYATGDEMTNEIEKFANIGKALSTLTSVRHFYARRKGAKKSKKVAKQTISIGGELYQVSSAYLAEISDKPKEEKRDLLLAHADTKKEDITEL